MNRMDSAEVRDKRAKEIIKQLKEHGELKQARISLVPSDKTRLRYFIIAEYKDGDIRLAECRIDKYGEVDLNKSGFDYNGAKDRYQAMQWVMSYFTGIMKEERGF